MAGTVSGLHQFQNDTGPEPLALLDQNYGALTVALNTLQTFSNYYPDIGTINSLNVQTSNTQFVAYQDGLQVTVKVANATTATAPTLNVNNLGAAPIRNNNGTSLNAGQLFAGAVVTFTYSTAGNCWLLPYGGGSGGSGGGTFQGTVTIAPPPGQGTTLIVEPNAIPNSAVMVVEVPPATTRNQYAVQVGGGLGAPPSGAAAGCSNGMIIAAGTNSADGPLLLQNDAGTSTFMQVRGDGSGTLGAAGGGMQWDTAGHFSVYGTGTFPGGGSGGGGATALSQLTDCSVSGMTNGQVLTWNNATQKWMNENPGAGTALANLSDVTIASPATGQVLTWNGLTWTNAAPTGGGGGTQPSWVAPVHVTLPTGTYSGTSLIVDGALNPNASTIVVSRPARTITGQWDMALGDAGLAGPPSGSAAGCSNGLYIGAGTNATDSPIWITNDAGTASFFRIHGDGSGFLGSSATNNFSWDTLGNFTWMKAPATTLNQWMFSIGGGASSGAAPGYSNALFVAGGTNATDYCCQFQNDASTQTFFYIHGDGSGFLGPSSTVGLKWTAAGAFTAIGGATFPGGGGGALSGLSDVAIVAPLKTWNVLGWNGTAWTNVPNAPNPFNQFTAPSVWNNNAGSWFLQVGSAQSAGSGISPGFSNGLFVGAGLNALDVCVWFMNDNGAYSYFKINGDGTGHIGPGWIKGMDWDVNGVFTLYATSGIRCAANANISFAAIGTTATAANVVCDATTGNLMQSTSARRYKTDIKPVSRQWARRTIKELCVVAYHSLCKADDPNRLNYGLVAEDVAEVAPELVHYDAEGKPQGVQYERVLLLLLPLMQELLEAN